MSDSESGAQGYSAVLVGTWNPTFPARKFGKCRIVGLSDVSQSEMSGRELRKGRIVKLSDRHTNRTGHTMRIRHCPGKGLE